MLLNLLKILLSYLIDWLGNKCIEGKRANMDINKAKEWTDRETDVNNPDELTNINNIVNGQMDVSNTNRHTSTCEDIKVRIYFSQNAINLDFEVTDKL